MNNPVDRFLNHITMYRLVLYYLLALLAVALGVTVATDQPFTPLSLIFSTAVITAACWLTNWGFAKLLRLPVNVESIYITALIVALVMPPVELTDGLGISALVLASVVAIASKFILAIQGKHVFNPVAIGIFASAMALDMPATWWVGGNMTMLPVVVIGGLLIVRKVQRFAMLAAYAAANVAISLLTTSPDMYGETLYQTAVYSPLFFAGFAMLTEPMTAPSAKWPGLVYGAIVGALSSPAVHAGEFYFTPEIAFLFGNVFAWIVSPKGRFKLTLLRVEKVAAGCYEFVFRSSRPLAFKAGQYLDWTIAVAAPDNRGNRRPFTIASAPSSDEIHLGVKFYKNPSAFKKTLLEMKAGDTLYGSQLAGEFTLPRDTSEKLVFIAGGIGVTPFRSMLQEMINRRESRPVVMFYGNNTAQEIAYVDVFDRAERELGIKTVYTVADSAAASSNMHQGFVDTALIQREVPDFRDRTFYISGPRSMVVKFEQVLKDLGISRSRIKVDFFPGFA
jgi:glycine betaine catabolism B